MNHRYNTHERLEAAKAAAFTVVALHYGLDVESVSTFEAPDMERWVPWANAQDHWCNPPGDWMDVAILAAEIISHRADKAVEGPQRGPIELDSLHIADLITSQEPLESDPMVCVFENLCSEWWDMPDSDERRECVSEAKAELQNLWQKASKIVWRYQPQISELFEMLITGDGEGEGYLSRKTVSTWWDRQREAA